jgi:3-dehydroquinate synthetase
VATLQATLTATFQLDVVPALFDPDNPALADAWLPAQRLLVVRDGVAGDRAELLAGYLRAAQRRGELDDFLCVDVDTDAGHEPRGTGMGACDRIVEAAVKAQLGRRDALMAFSGEPAGRVVAVAAASFRRHTAAVRVHRDLAAMVCCLRDGIRAALPDAPVAALVRRTRVFIDEDGVLARPPVRPAERVALLTLALLDEQLMDRLARGGVDGCQDDALAAVLRLCRQLGPGHPGWRMSEEWLSLAPTGLARAWQPAWALLTAARVGDRLGLLPARVPHQAEALAERLELGGGAVHVDAGTARRWLAGRTRADDGSVRVVLPTMDGGAEPVDVDGSVLLRALTDPGRPAAPGILITRGGPDSPGAPAGGGTGATVRLRTDLPASFPVRLTEGLLDPDTEVLAELLPERCQVLAVVDPYAPDQLDRVHRLLAGYRERGYLARFTVVPVTPTERAKTMDQVARVLHTAEGLGLGGDDRLIAVGGGTVLDIVGYAAYLYRRDTPYIRIPTTLVGMIDAGIGLKVGVNVNSHKNLLGAYHPPLACVCDTALLRTLPAAELRCGLAEAIKMGAICDLRLFALIERHHRDALAAADTEGVHEILARSVSAMLQELSANPFEEELRRLPDFGHEFGHALESVSGYRLRHGEAVAIGMALSSYLAFRTGYLARADLDRLLALLHRVGLAVYDPVCDPDVLWRRLNDEVLPHKAGRLHLVVPGPIGTGNFIDSIDAMSVDLLRDACAELRASSLDGAA